jgi:hypothetical protein
LLETELGSGGVGLLIGEIKRVSPSDHIFLRCDIVPIGQQEIGYTALRHILEDSTPREPQEFMAACSTTFGIAV